MLTGIGSQADARSSAIESLKRNWTRGYCDTSKLLPQFSSYTGHFGDEGTLLSRVKLFPMRIRTESAIGAIDRCRRFTPRCQIGVPCTSKLPNSISVTPTRRSHSAVPLNGLNVNASWQESPAVFSTTVYSTVVIRSAWRSHRQSVVRLPAISLSSGAQVSGRSAKTSAVVSTTSSNATVSSSRPRHILGCPL